MPETIPDRTSNAGPSRPASDDYDLIRDAIENLTSGLQNREERYWRVLRAIEALRDAARWMVLQSQRGPEERD